MELYLLLQSSKIRVRKVVLSNLSQGVREHCQTSAFRTHWPAGCAVDAMNYLTAVSKSPNGRLTIEQNT